MKRIVLCGIAVSILPISSASAETLTDTAWVQAGVFRPSFNTQVQVDIPNTPVDGTPIGFEDDLGLANKKTVLNVEAGGRLTNNLRIEGGYFSIGRNAKHTLNKDIRWEDTIYPADAKVDAGFQTDIYRLALGYSLLKSQNTELGVRLGAHITKFDMFIEGTAAISGQPLAQKREQKETTIPLPSLGAYANQQLSNTLTAHASLNYLALKVGDKKGGLADISAGLSARVTPNIGVGVRYRYVDYWLKIRSDDWRGKVDYNFKGPTLFLEAAF